MKRFLKGILGISSVALLMLASCKKDGALVTTNGGSPGSLTPSTTAPVLDKSKVTDPANVITFNFTAAQYTYTAATTSSLQIDAAGDNWKNPATVTVSSKSTTQAYNTADFNNILLKLNLAAGVPAKVNVRMQYSLSTAVNVYSNTTSLNVTPFNLTSWLYVPGDYEGWHNDAKQANAPNEDSLISVTGNGVYVGIIDFRGFAGASSPGTLQFKLVPIKGDWSHSYGTFDSGTNTTVVLDGKNDGNLWVPTAAPYLITVNLNNNTISAVPANYYSVIGDAALGWGTDTNMEYINDGNGNWAVTLPLVSTGAFKVRENNDWTYSWGIPKAGEAGDGIPNTLNDTKNDNLTVAASGNYKVTFFSPMSASSASYVPPVTTTYTVTKQ